MALHRIASLLPAATEIVADCGMIGQLVGRSHDSDYPAKIDKIPVLTAPRISMGHRSRELDLLNDVLSIYQIDLETLKHARPDILITQCRSREMGVSFDDVTKALSDYLGQTCKIVSVAPETLDEVMETIEVISMEIGAPHKGTKMVQDMTVRLEKSKEKLAPLISRHKPTVVALEAFNPLTTVGHWIPQMIRQAGAIDPFNAEEYHTRYLTWDQINEADPDMVVMIPYGLSLPASGVAVRNIHQNEMFRNLRAFKAKQVYVFNGGTYFNRPGPRVINGFEILAEVFHPDLYNNTYTYMGTGWAEYF